MNQENSLSPFAALSYKEQQDRWLEWRSRQLDYRAIPSPMPAEAPSPAEPCEPELPPIPLPQLRDAAPTRHRELDQVWARHQQALKRAGAFHSLIK